MFPYDVAHLTPRIALFAEVFFFVMQGPIFAYVIALFAMAAKDEDWRIDTPEQFY